MQHLIYLFCLSLLGCSLNSNINTKCKEDLEFKKEFFTCINNIESATYNKKNQDSLFISRILYNKSISLLSQFSLINYSYLCNYSEAYSPINFEEEKTKWLQWYDENKCKNLKWNDKK